MGGNILELPEGPVTIMFTDIEGSTALRTTLGDAEADRLFREHEELVRSEIEANKGHDQKAALGDGFLAVFLSTRRAVACAIGIQRALDTFNRGRPGAPLLVRIGLNTGEVAWQDGQLSGEAVHAAARVCAEASGGQILVSDVTRQLAGTIADVTFHDSGEHQLKGFPQPWHLWEVVWVRETSAVPEQVFVGREHELSMLRAKLTSALDGRGGLVLVGGEPGVGKTTLVRQLIREAEQRGALAVFGRCYESEGTVPYSPFVEMLEQALGIMPADIVREDMGEDAPEVARMVPELRRRFPDTPEPLDLPPEQQRRYFFNAVGAFVTRGAARFPLMLVMDDVHWADEPTLLLIEHMAAIMPDVRVFGVGTYRDVELDVARPLAATLERLLRGRLVERISLKRFDRDGVATMLEALAGRTPPDQIVGAVFEETEGNPFFVEEVFRHLVEEGKVFDADGNFRADVTVDELDVPESVRLVVGRRLERLGEQAQKVLAAGAVVGRAFPFSLLEVITEIDAGTLLDIVEEAEAARVIVPEERDGEIHYSFAHELIRQTLLGSISLLRRQRLHLTVANAIESTDKRAREERPSEIANHLMQAGAAVEGTRTLEYLELSADRAMEAAAFEEALRAIEDALSVVDEEDTLRRAQLLERKGLVIRGLGDFEGCLPIWEEVLSLYEQTGEREAAGRLAYEMAYVYIWLNRFAEAFSTYARGAAIFGDERTPMHAINIGGTGGLMGLAGMFDESERRLAEALEIAQDTGDDRAIGLVLWGRCLATWCNGRLHEAVESGLESVERLRRAGDMWALVDALAWTAFPLGFAGRIEEALRLAAEGVALGAKLGHIGGGLLCQRGFAIASALTNQDLEWFENNAREDLATFASIRSPWASQSHAWIASIRILRGDPQGALREAEEAIALEPASAWTGIGWSYKVLALAWSGDTAACRVMLGELMGSLPKPGEILSNGRTSMLFAAAQSASLLGLKEEARVLYPSVAERVEVMPIGTFDVTLAQRVAGMVASTSEQWDEADTHFREALRQAGEIPNQLDRPMVMHWYGKMLIDRGMPEGTDRARELIEAALAEYRQFEMPLHAVRAEQLLSQLA